MRAVLPAVLVALVYAVTACTGGSSPSERSQPATSSAPSASASPSPTPPPAPPPPPERAACYRLSAAQLTRPTNESRAVPCTSRHTARTIFVGRLDTVVDGHAVAVDSAAVQRQLATTCPRKLAAYLGGTQRERDLSRFDVVWWSPTIEQSDLGADWFRCDVVAFAGQDSLLRLPDNGPAENVLDRPGALDTYGLCGTAAPGEPRFRRVVCGRPHSWRAFDTIAIPGGPAYPGAGRVRTAGDEQCKARAQTRARSRGEDTLRFRYGWEWPTRAQWQTGQRFGYCWAPD